MELAITTQSFNLVFEIMGKIGERHRRLDSSIIDKDDDQSSTEAFDF